MKRAHRSSHDATMIASASRVRRRLCVPALTVVALVLAAILMPGCDENGTGGASPEATTSDLTGFWVLAGEQTIAPEAMIRVAATGDGYLVEPQSWQGTHWSTATRDGDALTMEATGPNGDTYVVRLEPSGEMAKLTIGPAEGDGQPLFTADLARPAGDYADLAAQFEGTLAEANETAVKESIHALQIAVQSWIVDHNDKAPPVDEVRPGGEFETSIDQWPTNPYTGDPMEPGDAPGDYTYERLDSGQGYRLSGHLEGGDFTVP